MRWVRFLPAVGAAVMLLVGALVFVSVIPIHHVERSRLSRLVQTKPPAGFSTKPGSSAEIPSSSVPFSDFKTAAKRSPNQTGAYAIQWPGTTLSSTNTASVLTLWLPTTSDAAGVQKQALSNDLSAASLKASDNYALEHRFAVVGLPGAQGALYGAAGSKSNQAVGVVVWREGRYVVIDFVGLGSAAKAQAEAISAAEAQDLHLRQVGPGFTLSVTHWPLEASLILAGAIVALAALVVLVPLGVSRARRRRRLAREAADRRAVKGRGRKIAGRQAARTR